MPRFRQTAEILRLMSSKKRIRNVGVIAHIDHGKTTLTDSLLIKAGLLSAHIGGSARVLDYLEEEQKRGITIKASNISFLHEKDGETYLVNLVDTPGHVDFTGKVARALRIIDGAIVVVDSVEEIMAQTETVTRQALEERVKPVLFINKVDRLFQELRLSSAEIQEKFIRIISDFNNLIETYAEEQFKEKWKVDPRMESVVFGSALHRWGLTLKIAETKGVKFTDFDIMEAYSKGNYEKLSQIVPLHAAIFDMVVKNIPSPLRSQEYRIPRIWQGNLNSEIGEAMLNCKDNGPIMICVTSVKFHPDEGLVGVGRIFSGTLKQGEIVYLVNAQREARVQEVSLYMSAFREPANMIPSGNIAAVGLEGIRAGETIVDPKYKDLTFPFESFRASAPVMTLAIEPNDPKDVDCFLEALDRLAMEDPDLKTSVDQETGQYLISGMGELHLEVAVNSLKRYADVAGLKVSAPIASYRETISRRGSVVMTQSLNKLNKFWIRVEPLDKRIIDSLESNASVTTKAASESILELDAEEIWGIDEHMNVFIDSTRDSVQVREMSDSILSGFHWACRNGPLCRQPLRGVKVMLVNAISHTSPEDREPVQIERAVSRAILGSFLTAKHDLLEPIFRIEVSVPTQWLGICSKIITNRRGKVERVEQRGPSAIIIGYVSVAQTFGLSAEMRSATSGRAFWQTTFAHWGKVVEKELTKVIRQLREKRGLPDEIPKAQTFVDEICL